MGGFGINIWGDITTEGTKECRGGWEILDFRRKGGSHRGHRAAQRMGRGKRKERKGKRVGREGGNGR